MNIVGQPRRGPAMPYSAKTVEAVAIKPVVAEVTSSLKSRLAAAVNGRRVIAAGAFHFVGLNEFHERLGNNWERVREKVHMHTRRIIERHTSPRDVYFSGGSDDYVLV